MNISLASCAELYAEHRRTASPRKRAKIAAELQRRHDEQNYRPGYPGDWFVFEKSAWIAQFGGFRKVHDARWVQIQRFQFALWLP